MPGLLNAIMEGRIGMNVAPSALIQCLGFSASASETVALPRRAGFAWLGSAFHPLR